jgi:SEC-C motif-containing protein
MTAAQLMRSRYCAYYFLHKLPVNKETLGSAEIAKCLCDQQTYLDYLIDTHLDTDKTEELANEILNSAQNTAWTGLYLVSRKGGMAEDLFGEVEFIASFEQNGTSQCLHENSRFKKIKGRWYYLDGDFIQSVGRHYNNNHKRYETKSAFSRNDLCWCDSGKKYKKCHAS